MTILGIDPGPERSAAVEWDGQDVTGHDEGENPYVLAWVRGRLNAMPVEDRTVIIEQPEARYTIVSQGVLDTALWAGRFQQAAVELIADVRLIKPLEWHIALASANVSSAGIKAALVDRLGGQDRAYGLKCEACHGKAWIGKSHAPCLRCSETGWIYPPGPMKGLTEHERDALALCLVGMGEPR